MRWIMGGIFVFLLPFFGYPQPLTGLLKEEFRENQKENGSWEPESRFYYSYDSKGQLTYRKRENWMPEFNRWLTQFETSFTYDGWGNVVNEIRRNYTRDESQELKEEFIQSSIFYDSLILERRKDRKWREEEDPGMNSSSSENQYYFYTSDGIIDNYRLDYKWVWNYLRVRYNQIIQYSEGCKLWETNERSENYQNGGQYNYNDSIIYANLNYLNYSCLPLKRDQYLTGLDYGGSYPVLSEEWEYEFENGLMSKELYFRQDDWREPHRILYSSTYQYDRQGRLIERIDSSFWDGLYVSRNITEYDELEEGLFRKNIYQEWDSVTSTWISLGIYENLSNDLEEIYFAYHNIWNKERQDFDENYEQHVLPDENDTIKRYTGRVWGYDSYNDVDYDYTMLDSVIYRCDGFEIESGSRLIDGEMYNPYGLENYPGRRRVYTYYDFPVCENQDKPNHILLFPIPATNVLNVILDGSIPSGNITIIDSNGSLVQDQRIGQTNYLSLDVHLLPSGIYILRIDGGDQLYTEKLVISK